MIEPEQKALYGLKYNPFFPDIPPEHLWRPPGLDLFLRRIDPLVQRGGFALITGPSGIGKSKTLHLVSTHLEQRGEVVVGTMERPHSSLSDFYRELGDLFGVELSVANRYGGFKALRARWLAHISSTLTHPVLLIDEAQEANDTCLNELRLLASANFDSQCLLTTILCGDDRLPDRFRSRVLVPLGSRIRVRLVLTGLYPSELENFLDYSLQQAGSPHLMTDSLKTTLCEHAAGNLRILADMAGELLEAAAQRELPQLDEKLFLEHFSSTVPQGHTKRSAPRASQEARQNGPGSPSKAKPMEASR